MLNQADVHMSILIRFIPRFPLLWFFLLPSSLQICLMRIIASILQSTLLLSFFFLNCALEKKIPSRVTLTEATPGQVLSHDIILCQVAKQSQKK